MLNMSLVRHSVTRTGRDKFTGCFIHHTGDSGIDPVSWDYGDGSTDFKYR